jgi:hypothetical protein
MINSTQGEQGGYLTQAGCTWIADKKQKHLRKTHLLKTPWGEKPADFVEVAINDVAHFAHVNTGTLYKDGRAVNSRFLEMLHPMTPKEVANWERMQ